MFPDPPYPGFTWPLTQHMGVLSQRNLYHILWAAVTYSGSSDPASRINEYIIANDLWTPNIRSDSGQPDAWRDYQQVLSELALIFSTNVQRTITPTPLGLAYLDGIVSFSELITLQALRYQYPNAHKRTISPALRETLSRTEFEHASTLTEIQQLSGVMLRPAVLTWRILRLLENQGEVPRVSLDEIATYLMRCSTHGDVEACCNAVIRARRTPAILPPLERGRRNSQDWIKFLLHTPLFSGTAGRDAYVDISSYVSPYKQGIDALCLSLERPDSFWKPGRLDRSDRLSWYSWYGTLNVTVPMLSDITGAYVLTEEEEFPGGREEHDEDEGYTPGHGELNLRDFRFPAFLSSESMRDTLSRTTVESTYDASLSTGAHRLHDQMLVLIAAVCRARGALVQEDPQSIDLLVQYSGTEFVIEVKSVTARNFVPRLRYAIGQVCHYDYLRSLVSSGPRRRVIGFAARVPRDNWSLQFLNDHLDVDVLSLYGTQLRVDSPSSIARELFSHQ